MSLYILSRGVVIVVMYIIVNILSFRGKPEAPGS